MDDSAASNQRHGEGSPRTLNLWLQQLAQDPAIRVLTFTRFRGEILLWGRRHPFPQVLLSCGDLVFLEAI